MKEVRNRFAMLEYTSPKEALLQVFSFLLNEGKTKNYGIYYIWAKDDKYYTELSGAYHSVDLWRNMEYRTYDIVEIKNYKRKYADKEETLTGFMFHGNKFFDGNIDIITEKT